MGGDRQQIFRFAATIVVNTFSFTDAAEIKAVSRGSCVKQRARHGRYDLIVHRAAKQRVRMCNDSDGNRRLSLADMGRHFDRTGLASDQALAGGKLAGHKFKF